MIMFDRYFIISDDVDFMNDDDDEKSNNSDGLQKVPSCATDDESGMYSTQLGTEQCVPDRSEYVFSQLPMLEQMATSSAFNISPTISFQTNKRQANGDAHAQMADESDGQSNDHKRHMSENFTKQAAYFPTEHGNASTDWWYLYRIYMTNNDGLGFIVPCKWKELPIFNLYEDDEELRVQVVYIGQICYKAYQTQLEQFHRYIFEEVFTDMNTGFNSHLTFDFKHSAFKLLPCFLTKSDTIDYQRMAFMCERKKKLIQNFSELCNEEIYTSIYPSNRQFYKCNSVRVLSEGSFGKRIIAVMECIKKPNQVYLKSSSSPTNKKAKTSNDIFECSSLEDVRYASVNQIDLQLIYKLPSLFQRISELNSIEQLRDLFPTNIESCRWLPVDQMPVVTFKDCLASILPSNPSTVLLLESLSYEQLSNTSRPFHISSALLFQAITTRSTNEHANMRNLATLGDSFFKLVVSISLYHRHSSATTGSLTEKRDKAVSNEFLYEISVQKNLNRYLNSEKKTVLGASANWIPPGYRNTREASKQYTKQEVKHKVFADMIEALIGAVLISTDCPTAIKFMAWLGLDVIPQDEHGAVMETPSVLQINIADDTDTINSKIKTFYDDHSFIEIEQNIKYTFNNKAYLIAAFTHSRKNLTIDYTRLKFLGNVLLEFLVTRYAYITDNSSTSDSVTKIRQGLLNRDCKANMLVTHQLHKRIQYISPKYSGEILAYAAKVNDDQATPVAAPTVLGDVLEALVGAIFLDSNCHLKTVWDIIDPLIRQNLDKVMVDIKTKKNNERKQRDHGLSARC